MVTGPQGKVVTHENQVSDEASLHNKPSSADGKQCTSIDLNFSTSRFL